jgi:hypothetical protein
MTEKQSIDVKEKLAIGAIASFFGTRYGQRNVDRIFKTVGIEGLSGSKSEKISFVLTDYFKKDPSSFATILETLIQYHSLPPKDIEILRISALRLGFDIEDKHVVPTIDKEIVLSENKPFDAFKVIEKILLSAKNRICIIDPYVDESLFPLYFADVSTNVEIKILTTNMHGKFKEVAKKFKGQRPSFEVRLSNDIHDRHVMIDGRAWVFGQSIKNAGGKSLSIIECEDPKSIETNFLRLWGKSKIFL